MLCWLLMLCPPLWRWVLSLRPQHRMYHPVRWVLEFGRIMQKRYDADWDAYVSTCIDLGMIYVERNCTQHIIEVGDYSVWISNFPYACGEPIMRIGDTYSRVSHLVPYELKRSRPSIMTLYRLLYAAKAAWRAEEERQKHMQQMENQHVR